MGDEKHSEPLTDDELDALDAEITHDSGVLRAMQDALMVKVRRYRTEVAFKNSATVHQFPVRPSGGMPEGDGE